MRTQHNPPLTAVTIGNFDGVHLGHAELIRRARLAVGPKGRVIALAFHPHPAVVIRPSDVPPTITTFDQRARALAAAGADETLRLHPTSELLATDPAAFIQSIAERHRPAVIVEGSDFRFGSRRSGDVDLLAVLGSRLDQLALGFETIVLDPVQVALTDHTVVTASSTIIRWLLERGRVSDAARVLGRPYRLEGTVVKGDQRGRTIGVPTANLDTPNMLPADGVYAGIARLPSGLSKPAAVHVGPRETFGAHNRTLEVHVLDWAGPGTTNPSQTPSYAYNWTLSVDLIAWLREQARYDSVQALVEQMQRDIGRARGIAERQLEASTEPIRESSVNA